VTRAVVRDPKGFGNPLGLVPAILQPVVGGRGAVSETAHFGHRKKRARGI
jgi:hypothetical protein